MKDIYENRQWHNSNVNNLENSTIHSYLNGTFLNLFESNIRDAIKQVKLPYRKNGGSGGSDQSGANGLLCKIFLLSGYEIGFTTSDNSYFPVDGAKLSYFEAGTGSSALNKRIAYLNGSAAYWWLRSPVAGYTDGVWGVYSGGDCRSNGASNSYGVRPALILPSTLLVSDDGTVSTNTPPTITSTSGASGVNLGSKTAAFSFKYTPNDADGDKLTVTEKLDGAVNAVCAAHVVKFKGDNLGSSPAEPMQTVTAGAGQKKACGGGTFALCDTLLCKAGPDENLYRWPLIRDLLNRYCGYELADDDLLLLSIGGTLYFIADIGLRMLSPRELYNAMGFPPDYIIDRDYMGNPYPKNEQVARCGNAVCPPMAAAVARANFPEYVAKVGGTITTMAALLDMVAV